MIEQYDWRVGFQVAAEDVYDAIMGPDHLSTHFELVAGGIQFRGLPRPHLGPPGTYWIILYGTFSLDQATAAHYGLRHGHGEAPPPREPAAHEEDAILAIQIWRTASDACEAELRIASPDVQPHQRKRYMDGLPPPEGRLASLLAAFMEAFRRWPAQGGPQPWLLGRPDLVVQRYLNAEAPELSSPPANGHAAAPVLPAARRGGRPCFPEDD